jgi:hypothetical protein
MESIKKSVGFVILRHVNSEETNKYWQHCYECVRKFYPDNNILIVDDNSNYEYLTNIKLYKTVVVYSEYTGRGELLPYIYYLQYKIADIAVFLHDSVFINSFIDFNVDNYKLLWEFESNSWSPNPHIQPIILNAFNDKELLEFYENKSLWKGCFGGMVAITHNYLTFINDKYNLSILINIVLTRPDREAFERVIACLLQKHFVGQSISGNIHSFCPWGIKFDEKNNWEHLPIIKVWTGR